MSEISRFHVPTLDEMPDDIRTRIETVSEKSGFVPNVFVALAAASTAVASRSAPPNR